jgi:hypothetical protein
MQLEHADILSLELIALDALGAVTSTNSVHLLGELEASRLGCYCC